MKTKIRSLVQYQKWSLVRRECTKSKAADLKRVQNLGGLVAFLRWCPAFVHSPRVVSVLSAWGCESKIHVRHDLAFQEGIYSISLDGMSQTVLILSPTWLCGSHKMVGLRVNQTELSPPRLTWKLALFGTGCDSLSCAPAFDSICFQRCICLKFDFFYSTIYL